MGDTQLSIRALRIEKGLTQEELADVLGVNVKTISEWENNKVPIKNTTVFALAYVFKIDADIIRV